MDTQRTKRSAWSWPATGGALCFAGGILAALVGSLLTASTWILGGQLHPWIRSSGTVLLIITIPLLIFAGYCMDWAEREKSEHGANLR